MKFTAALLSAALFSTVAVANEPAKTTTTTTPTTTTGPATTTPTPTTTTTGTGMMDKAKQAGTMANEKIMVNINTASTTDLQKVPGLTPETADQIVANRPYKSVNELSKVKGLKQDMIAKIKPYVTTK